MNVQDIFDTMFDHDDCQALVRQTPNQCKGILRGLRVELRDRRTLERVEMIDGFGFPYQALEVPGGILVADRFAGAYQCRGALELLDGQKPQRVAH